MAGLGDNKQLLGPVKVLSTLFYGLVGLSAAAGPSALPHGHQHLLSSAAHVAAPLGHPWVLPSGPLRFTHSSLCVYTDTNPVTAGSALEEKSLSKSTLT